MGKKKDGTAPAPGDATVVKEFRDIDDFSKVYAVGDDVTDFDEKRKANALTLGLISVAVVATEPENPPA